MVKTDTQLGLKEIAKEVGMSISTVSRALSNDSRISADTRRKVLATTEILRGGGAILRPTVRQSIATKCIGLIQPSHDATVGDTEVSVRVIASLQEVAEQSERSVVSGQIHRTRSGVAALGIEQGLSLDGVIGYRLTDEDISSFISTCQMLDLPFVLLNRNEQDSNIASCTVNHKAAGIMATEHLINLGHKKIGAIFNDLRIQSSQLRLKGMREIMARNGLILASELIQGDVSNTQQIGIAIKKSIESGATALVTAHDRLGHHVLTILMSMGIKVPDDISVISFDGTKNAATSHPPLTSVYTPWPEMAKAAGELLGKLNQDTLLSGAKLIWRPTLHIGDSCARYKSQTKDYANLRKDL